MMKSLQFFCINLFIVSFSIAQSLCPPEYVETFFFDQEVYLEWEQTNDFGDVLSFNCFPNCSTATTDMTMTIDHVVDSGTGGWFRYSDSTEASCGSGMYPCNDGENDDYSAYASYSGLDTANATPVDSRLITEAIDLTNMTSASLEFIEAYTYPEDVNDSNMVEVSIDGGETWEIVYVSYPDSIGEDFYFISGSLDDYVGNIIHVAFRYYDSVGYGEAWFVDEIKVSGNNDESYAGCGTLTQFNIYANGILIDSTSNEWYTATGLENGTEYCFEVKAVYDEGESESAAISCATPQGPFQINPAAINFDELASGQYEERTFTIRNFDTLSTPYNITGVELSNVQYAFDVLTDPMEGSFATFTDPGGFLALWGVGDSSGASSQYFPVEVPDDGGNFAYVNDDAIGEGVGTTDAWLVSNEISVTGGDNYPVFLLFDAFFPNPGGPCWTGNAYRDDFIVWATVDDGASWIVLDSTLATGWEWQSYMYNITPHLGGATTFKVAFNYHDCEGEWGYGVALDNVAVKEGDDFTWITVSPYKGVATYNSTALSANDSITVTVGVYGTYDGFSELDELIIASNAGNINVNVGVGVVVSIDENSLAPFEFALHQNYPNPFNPKTKIQFDVASETNITISIYNIVGQKVATLMDGNLNEGSYNVSWNGTSDSGEILPTGMYFYEMKSTEFHSVKKLIFVK